MSGGAGVGVAGAVGVGGGVAVQIQVVVGELGESGERSVDVYSRGVEGGGGGGLVRWVG